MLRVAFMAGFGSWNWLQGSEQNSSTTHLPVSSKLQDFHLLQHAVWFVNVRCCTTCNTQPVGSQCLFQSDILWSPSLAHGSTGPSTCFVQLGSVNSWANVSLASLVSGPHRQKLSIFGANGSDGDAAGKACPLEGSFALHSLPKILPSPSATPKIAESSATNV